MFQNIDNAADLEQAISHLGFLPLLPSNIAGFSAEEMVADDCGYVVFDDGGWDWPLWKWKGPIVTDGGFVYGKFFALKAGFISRDWWPDFCNYRRSIRPSLEEGSVEEAIVTTLSREGSLITRELRTACGFTGKGMRSRFDAIVARLQMDCRIVTEDFVYPHDKHGHPYGWGWSLLSTPERLYGEEACRCEMSPEASFGRILSHLKTMLPHATEPQLAKLIAWK